MWPLYLGLHIQIQQRVPPGHALLSQSNCQMDSKRTVGKLD